MRSRLHRNRKALVCSATFLLAGLAAAPASATPVAYKTFASPPQFATPPDSEPEPMAVPVADKEVGGGALFFGFGSFGNLRGLGLEASDGDTETDPLKGKHLRLDGGGQMMGGGIQVDIFGRYLRGGFAISVFGVEGTKLRYDSLSNQFSVRASGAWGAGLEVFIGHELLRGPVRPYVDLVGSVAVVSANVDLFHPEFGKLGRTEYDGWSFGLAPRLGISVPLGENAFFDLSGSYAIVGIEQARLVAGIGFWNR
jgi:hypothetical protein